MTDERTAREDSIRITRYRKLELEVTDPFTICPLRLIVEELETGILGQNRQPPEQLRHLRCRFPI